MVGQRATMLETAMAMASALAPTGSGREAMVSN